MRPFAPAAIAFGALSLVACQQLSAADQPPSRILGETLVTLGDGEIPAAKPLPGMFRRVDISRDGVDDWVVDYSDAQGWCGSGGCHLVVYVSGPDGAFRIGFEQQVREWTVTRRGGRADLDVEVYGGWCGGPGVAECRLRFVWDGDRFVEARNAAGQTRLHGPLYAPLEDRPPPLARATVAPPCVGRAPASPDLQAASVPDLDGDGARDVIVSTDTADAGRQTQVLVSSAGFASVLTIPGEAHEVDIATRPATLWAPAPGASPERPLVAYDWNPSACRFETRSP